MMPAPIIKVFIGERANADVVTFYLIEGNYSDSHRELQGPRSPGTGIDNTWSLKFGILPQNNIVKTVGVTLTYNYHRRLHSTAYSVQSLFSRVLSV